ncbi:protein of unknown function [Candidatus Nitrospira inopinata]|uniref:Uncharacterized protein n=1 Tax=Candidatus Nitrospira inopinata TaxID=1715989 RepID=A0A0S4KUH9_9BACT|nr:protein of unknown function [Candidatus Nitrospira inopinata]
MFVQDDRLLRAGARAVSHLERSDGRDHMAAGGSANFVLKGPSGCHVRSGGTVRMRGLKLLSVAKLCLDMRAS